MRAIFSFIEFMQYKFFKRTLIECEMTCVYFHNILSDLF